MTYRELFEGTSLTYWLTGALVSFAVPALIAAFWMVTP